MSGTLARATALAALVALAGCEHAQPFGPPDLGPNQPFASGFPRRLTFNPGDDAEPAWLPDGSGILYSFALAEPQYGRCLGVLPAGGGHRTATICHTPAAGSLDSTNALFVPAVGPGGALAYRREISPLGSVAPDSDELVVASLADPDPGRVVLRFPFTSSDGVLHGSAVGLHWLSATALVYIAVRVTYTLPPLQADTIFTPIRIERVDLAGDSVTVSVVPGTAGATSDAVDSTGALYYTLSGDSRIYRYDSSGVPAVVYDFGAAGAATGVSVAGGTLVAVAGGTLYAVDPARGARVALPAPDSLVMAAPALAPSDSTVVVEARAGGAGPADLWLLAVP